MADEVDTTNERIDFDNSISIRNTCACAQAINKGEPGDCDLCGETFLRVIIVFFEDEYIKSCGYCRDKYRIKDGN